MTDFYDFYDLNGFNDLNGFPCWEGISMGKGKNKFKTMLADQVRSQSGVSIAIVIFVMLVLSAIGYSMARVMAAKQKSVPVTAQSNCAFYMAESGIDWAGKELSETIWWDSTLDKTKNLGDGSFTISYSGYGEDDTKEWVIVTSTGYCGDAERVVNMTFERNIGFGCTP